MENVEMKVERSLLNPDFEGYKLSLESLPCYSQKLSESSKPKTLSDDQFSYFHAKLFAGHNVLVYDKFNGKTYLLSNKGEKIVEVKSQEGSTELNEVWTAPNPLEEGNEEFYNASLTFPSSNLAVYSDGQGQLYILNKEWNKLFQDEICGKKRPFKITSSLLSKDGKTLQILVQYIEDKSKVENLDTKISEKASNFINIIEWIELNVNDFNLERLRRFAFLGEIESLEVSNEGILCFAEEKPFQLLYDSSGMDEIEVEKEEEKEVQEKPPAFYWLQGVEDMAVWVMLPENTNKREIKVTLKPSEMSVTIKNETIFSGKLWNVIDSDSMTWTIDSKKQRLEITMCKANVGMMWQRFLADKNVQDGEEVMHADMVEKIHEQLSHLTTDDPNANTVKENSQVYNAQELDICDENSEVSRVFMLIKSPKVVQKVNVGDRQVLFQADPKEPELPSQICLRHDVDGLTWQPLISEGQLKFEHVDTFDALGYVQASKGQRRFTVCSPDRSYAAIIDRTRHVYVYRKPEAISEGCELRNRKSGQNVKKVAKQQVPTLDHDPDDFIVGAVATNQALFVASTRNLYCLKIH